MREIILSWEYPPRIVGQLANYVKTLAVQLATSRTEPYVVTYDDYLTGEQDEPEGVKTFRVTNPVRTHIGVLTWVLTLNQEVERVAANIFYERGGQVDVLDVQDWHFIPAAVTLKKALGIPFVYSVDSLEDHRAHGSNSPFNMAIKSIEWLGTYEAGNIIVKSDWMRGEASRLYKAPEEKMRVIQPGSAGWVRDILAVYRSTAETGAIR